MLRIFTPLNSNVIHTGRQLRKAEAIINFGFILVPVVLLVGISTFLGLPTKELFFYALVLSGLALVLLLLAKLPILRAGSFFTFGPSPLPKHGRLLYYLSYGVLFMAVCAWVALAASVSLGTAGV